MDILILIMKEIEASGARAPYEAPWAEVYDVASGQSILISGSGTLPDGLEEGDEDTFLPAS